MGVPSPQIRTNQGEVRLQGLSKGQKLKVDQEQK